MIIGVVVVLQFNLIEVLTYPIQEYLPGAALDSATGRWAGGQLMVTHGAGGLSITMQLAFAVGLSLAFPVLLYQVWAFLSPALHKHERRTIQIVLGFATILFAAGVALAYLFAVPQTFALSERLARGSLVEMYEASQYFGFLTTMSLTFGLAFEVPIVLVVLSFLGVVSAKMLSAARKYAVIIVFIGSAIITPGDALTATLILALPLYFLFEMSIIAALFIERRKQRKKEAADAEYAAASDQNLDDET
jgi:sec-independent protein translocase protein TatC